jgi:hypothetical protein
MDLKAFTQGLRNAITELKAEAPKLVRVAAMDSVATVERRIKEKGFGKEYSKKGVPAFFFHGKELNSKGKRFLEDDNYFSDKDDLVTWAEFRSFQGLQSDHVDLSYTNRMWTGISVLGVTEVSPGTYQAQVGGTDKEVDDKIRWNMERYGDFLQPTETEQSELLEDTKMAILDILNKHLT